MKPLDAVHVVARTLDEAGVPSPRVDAELLVAHVLGKTRSRLYASDRAMADGELARLGALVAFGLLMWRIAIHAMTRKLVD